MCGIKKKKNSNLKCKRVRGQKTSPHPYWLQHCPPAHFRFLLAGPHRLEVLVVEHMPYPDWQPTPQNAGPVLQNL